MKTVFVFILLIVIVVFLQYDLLKPALKVGLTPDDWSFILIYRLLGSNPLSKFAEVWVQRGPYTTVPIYYTGSINSIVGFNYLNLQLVSIFFKTLATLVIFPLVLVISKNKLLAFLSTILFAMSYPSAGPLETAVEPSEYLGMFSMGIFLTVYYKTIKDDSLKWSHLGLATILLVLTILLSATRLYPLVAFIPIVEIYLLIKKPKISVLKSSVLRLAVLFSPFIFIFLYYPKVILNYIGTVPTVILKVVEGNWHLILTPLQGVGHSLPFTQNLKFLGIIKTDAFDNYLFFILAGPSVVFGVTIFLLAFLKSKNPWRFFLLTFLINFFLEIFVFFIARHYLAIPSGSRMNFDVSKIYLTLFGLFIIVLTFMYWVEWEIQGRKNSLFLAIWTGPTVSFIFIALTWVLADINLSFGGAQDHYLMIPAAGMSVFVAGLLTLTYERARIMATPFIFITLIIFYFLNRSLIYSYFDSANKNGRAAAGQEMIQSRFREKIKDIDLSKPALFYFDTSELSSDGPFYTEGLLSILPFFTHFRGNDLIDGCTEVFYESKQKLAQLIQQKGAEKGFVYRSLCVRGGKGGYSVIFYKPENFYAFRLKNKDFIDIKAELLEELGFNF